MRNIYGFKISKSKLRYNKLLLSFNGMLWLLVNKSYFASKFHWRNILPTKLSRRSLLTLTASFIIYSISVILFLINRTVMGYKKDELTKTYDVEIPIEIDHNYSMTAFTSMFKVGSVQSIWYLKKFPRCISKENSPTTLI